MKYKSKSIYLHVELFVSIKMIEKMNFIKMAGSDGRHCLVYATKMTVSDCEHFSCRQAFRDHSDNHHTVPTVLCTV